MTRYHLRVDCGTAEEVQVPYTAEEEARADADASKEPDLVPPPVVTLSPNEAGDAITVAVEYGDGTVKTADLPLT